MKTISFETIEQGSYSGYAQRQNYIIKTEEDWKLLRGDLLPNKTIDFSKEMVLAVFQGWKPSGGYGIEITSIRENKSKLEILIAEYVPGDSMVTMACTSPYHIVKVPKSEKEVYFKNTSLKDYMVELK